MANGFLNNSFSADGSVTTPTVAATQTITSPSFDGGYNVAVPGGWVSNLGISYSGGVLGIRGSTTTISASNPAYITMQSRSTPGRLKKYTITAEQSLATAGGSTEIIGNLFGLTTGIAYTQDIPFFIYAVVNDAQTAVAFMLSRVPHAMKSPPAANIGMPSNAIADVQSDFFSFDNVTAADYDSNPCLCIGSFRMRMGATDDWTPQTLNSSDGIGQFNDTIRFIVPVGTFGAAAGTFFFTNGGTAPLFTTNEYYYTISKDGRFHGRINLRSDPGTDGAGAVEARICVPYRSFSSGTNDTAAGLMNLLSVGSTQLVQAISEDASLPTYIKLQESGYTSVENGDFANGNRILQGSFSYQIRKQV